MKPSTVNNAASIFVLLVIGIVLLQVTTTYAAPHPARYYPGYYSPMQMEGANSEYLLQTIARLRQALNADDLENSKRGLDLGLGRGFSGSQAAKHLMGLAAANFAGGPGRKRRSDDEE
ncbi:diuretic hormone class 2 isoform X2 [Aethina tumida]|uniref:diuretic hormone class 2 isoform X2 n=1 Tax=Aethina tumida TaxID=116153 RepID=UPI0021474A0C|nr:diuretic hormone class 2 isoform X2 [Aethina tumida]